MVAVKCLSTWKIRVSGERERRKSGSGAVRSLKVYTETVKAKTQNKDHVDSESKSKSIPIKGETSHIGANCQKAPNKLEKIHGENISYAQSKVGRKVLADISNSRGNFLKNQSFDRSRPGKGKMERMPVLQRASFGTGGRTANFSFSQLPMGPDAGSQSEAVDDRPTLGRVGTKDLKVFQSKRTTRRQGQETMGDVTIRKPAKSYRPPQRKSLPVLKHVNEADTCDLKRGNLEDKLKNKEKCGFSVKPKVATTVVSQASNARDRRWKNRVSEGSIRIDQVKNKEKYGFSVKPKVATTVVPQVSNACDRRWKNRVSEGSIRMASQVQPVADAHRLSRRSMKPTVKTTFGIPRAQRVSQGTSLFSKSASATSVALSKRKEATSRSSLSKQVGSVACEQAAAQAVPSACNSDLYASTSTVTAKGKTGRRKSYTSLLITRSKLLEDHGDVPKEEILPNIYDDCNQLEVAEYVDEIYRHYWVTEAQNQSLKNYMKIQTDITPQMRGILINWLIEVHLKFDLMQETLYLMVTLLDYYLSIVAVKKNEMQLVGLTALLLASKYEDFWHPKVMELIGISAEVYTREQVLEMETTILAKLNFRLNLPTPYVFMLRFLRAAQAGKKFETLAFFLIELCLLEYDALQFKPSMLCASAIYVARCTQQLDPAWTPLLCKHSHYEEYQIRECAEMILRFHQAARTAMLKVTYDKYMSADNCGVARIRPLRKLPPMTQ